MRKLGSHITSYHGTISDISPTIHGGLALQTIPGY